MLLLRISRLLRSNHQATAKSKGYNQRYRENRTINTRRSAWRVIPLIEWCLQHIKFETKTHNQIRAVFSRNFFECLQPENSSSSFLLFRVDISGLQIMEYFSRMHKLHFLVTFEYNSACFTLRLLLAHWPFLSSNKCVACFVPFAVEWTPMVSAS